MSEEDHTSSDQINEDESDGSNHGTAGKPRTATREAVGGGGSIWLWWFNIFTNVIYMSLILLTIPLAFDVGGEECGLAFTVTLAIFYLSMATIRLLGRNTKFSTATQVVYYSQHVIIPSLFIMFLNLYNEDGNTSGKGAREQSVYYGLGGLVVRIWRTFLESSTALFAILEGFCTLLVIQTAGEMSRWLVMRKKSDPETGEARRSEVWTVTLLVVCANLVTYALYFLYRIYTFPTAMGEVNATLVGVLLTATVFIGGYGIASRRGTLVESSLLFAYMVFCLYETFTDFGGYSGSSGEGGATGGAGGVGAGAGTNYGGVDYGTALGTIARRVVETVPGSFVTVLEIVMAAMSTITPSIAVSLVYRMGVLFATTQIIPALGEDQTSSMSLSSLSTAPSPSSPPTPSLPPSATKKANGRGTKGKSGHWEPPVVVLYGPVVLIAVYSHLLMQHFGLLDAQTRIGGVSLNTWQLWSWTNGFVTLGLYTIELGNGGGGGGGVAGAGGGAGGGGDGGEGLRIVDGIMRRWR
ncbi:ICE2-domain-containing protein [Lipomyces oligophaga]|uniref:ICE2-domain-containing protein n=1 Tax=Lipomyces oligophaga TaxID=45792 RepID=UPI0034CE8C80